MELSCMRIEIGQLSTWTHNCGLTGIMYIALKKTDQFCYIRNAYSVKIGIFYKKKAQRDYP